MREAVKMLDRLRAKGEEIFTQVSAELMSNPRFVKAMETAWKGKAKLDQAVAHGLKTANIPTRTEFKKTQRRVEALEAQVEELKAALAKAKAPAGPRRSARKKSAAGDAAE